MNAQHTQKGKAASPDPSPSALRERWFVAAWAGDVVVSMLFVTDIPTTYQRAVSLSGIGMYATVSPFALCAALDELDSHEPYESVLEDAFILGRAAGKVSG